MTAFHVKFRPKSFSELDLPEVGQFLDKLFQDESKFPQALLFTGPKGAGKTSAARIVARVVNKLESDDTKNHLDIVEIDAATNTGVEDVRSMRDAAYLLPVELKYKVFIIDEVHQLSNSAFNALLKILEEPPRHVIFVLCTTEVQKIPETVLSRLTRVDFRRAGEVDILRALNKIVEQEKLVVDSETLKQIAEFADGSFRNGVRILNELVLRFGGKLDKEKVEDFFKKQTGSYGIEEFDKDLAAKRSNQILKMLDQIAEEQADMEQFLKQLLVFYQKQLLAENPVMPVAKLKTWLTLLLGAAKMQKDSPLPQLPLQLAVVEFLPGGDKSVGAAVLPRVTQIDEPIVTEEKCNFSEDIFTNIMDGWLNILREVRSVNVSVEAFLRACTPKEFKGGILYINVFYKFHKDRLSDVRHRSLVEKCVERICGTQCRVEFELSDKKQEIMVPETVVAAVEEVKTEQKPEDELYQAAQEIFG